MKIGNKEFVCSLDYGMEFIKGKWKALIICHLKGEPIRFLELQRRCPSISHKILAEKLKELELDGIIEKKVYDEVPLKVEYSLTKRGIKLYKVLNDLENWSKEYIKEFRNTSVE